MARGGRPDPPGPGPDRPWDVLCLGLNATDHLCLVEGFPRRGGKLQMNNLVTSGGGQCATAACALARLGRRTAYQGVCGDDEAGRLVEPRLAEYGVEPIFLKTVAGAASQEAFILVEAEGGERTIIWRRDDHCRLDAQDVDPARVARARALHLDGHFVEASLAAARAAKAAGTLVSLDGERIFPQTAELVSLCDVVVGEAGFAQRLTGRDAPREALQALADMGPAWVGRTMGAGGAELIAQGRYYHQPAFPVPAVDTTGAGDVFHAGLLHAILDDQDPAQALATASAVAAISVTALGGRSALPDAEELARFLEGR